MLAHLLPQLALSFGLIVASGLLLTLVNDLLTAAAEARRLSKARHNALVVEPLRPLAVPLRVEPDAPFKIITVRTRHADKHAASLAEGLSKAA